MLKCELWKTRKPESYQPCPRFCPEPLERPGKLHRRPKSRQRMLCVPDFCRDFPQGGHQPSARFMEPGCERTADLHSNSMNHGQNPFELLSELQLLERLDFR